MARNVALTIHVRPEEAEFLEFIGESSCQGKTTIGYLGIKDYIECHGFKAWLAARNANLSKSGSHLKPLTASSEVVRNSGNEAIHINRYKGLPL